MHLRIKGERILGALEVDDELLKDLTDEELDALQSAASDLTTLVIERLSESMIQSGPRTTRFRAGFCIRGLNKMFRLPVYELTISDDDFVEKQWLRIQDARKFAGEQGFELRMAPRCFRNLYIFGKHEQAFATRPLRHRRTDWRDGEIDLHSLLRYFRQYPEAFEEIDGMGVKQKVFFDKWIESLTAECLA